MVLKWRSFGELSSRRSGEKILVRGEAQINGCAGGRGDFREGLREEVTLEPRVSEIWVLQAEAVVGGRPRTWPVLFGLEQEG